MSNDKWICTKDRLPVRVDADRYGRVLTWRLGLAMIIKHDEVTPENASHWMPLPKAPLVDKCNCGKEGVNMTREDFIDQMVKEYSDKYVTYVGSREEIEKINMRALCEIIYNSQFFIDKGIEKLIQENVELRK